MNTDKELFDCHCHILPGIDDGAGNVDMSLNMLRNNREQNVAGVIATPHYYSEESIEDFLLRRQASFDALKAAASSSEVNNIHLCMGAEVSFRQNISRRDHFKDLCLGGSEYMLIEMPFRKWGKCEISELEDMIGIYGIIPVIAHIERYIDLQDRKTELSLYSLPVVIQSNAEYFLSKKTGRAALRAAKRGDIHLIASDCHKDAGFRMQNLQDAFGIHGTEQLFGEAEGLFRKAWFSAPDTQKF